MVKDKFKFKYQTSLLEIHDLFFDSRNKRLLINPMDWEVTIISFKLFFGGTGILFLSWISGDLCFWLPVLQKQTAAWGLATSAVFWRQGLAPGFFHGKMGNPKSQSKWPGEAIFLWKVSWMSWLMAVYKKKVSITFTWYVLMIVLMIYYDLCIAQTTTLGSSRNAILLPFYRSCLPIQTTIPGMPRFLQSNGSTETSVTFGFPSSKHEKRSRMQPGGGSTREAVGGFEQALQKDLWWCGLGHPEALPKSWVQRNLQLLCFTLKGFKRLRKIR